MFSSVEDALDGVVAMSGGELARLQGSATVIRRSKNPGVAVISGGGAGHEPSHAGFVGKGMLDGAVSGGIFASPSVDAVLNGIRAVAVHTHGALLIVKNYTGDRLSFGLAIERARQEGLPCEMVIVGDDIALPHITQPRGVAGTLFLHKICGYYAHVRGVNLGTLHQHASHVAKSVRSFGVAWSECNIPGRPRNSTESRFAHPGEAEMGMGIHGEPGAKKVTLGPSTLVDMVSALKLDHARRYALIVNHLGGSILEMQCVVHSVIEMCPEISLITTGHLMTSLDMHGFSLSVLDLDERPEYEEALLHPVACSAWIPMVKPLRKVPLVKAPATSSLVSNNSEPPNIRVVAAIGRVCSRLLTLEQELNELDRRVGDGDTGSTISSGCRTVMEKLPHLATHNYSLLFRDLSALLSVAMGGSSGVLLSIFFAAAAPFAAEDVFAACRSGVARMMQYGGGKPGDRTVLDAMVPAFECDDLGACLKAARAGCEATANMAVAKAGRAQYVPSLQGTKDPGAFAFVAAIEALVEEMQSQ